MWSGSEEGSYQGSYIDVSLNSTLESNKDEEEKSRDLGLEGAGFNAREGLAIGEFLD